MLVIGIGLWQAYRLNSMVTKNTVFNARLLQSNSGSKTYYLCDLGLIALWLRFFICQMGIKIVCMKIK